MIVTRVTHQNPAKKKSGTPADALEGVVGHFHSVYQQVSRRIIVCRIGLDCGKYRYCHRYRNTDAGHLDILFRMGPDPCEHPEGQPHYKKPCPCTHQDVLRRVNSQEVPADGDQRTYEPRHNPKSFRKFPANRGAAEQGRYAQTVTFTQKLDRLKEELLSGKRVPEHEKDYRKYFIIRETPKRGITLSYKQEAIDAARERYGFFVLISNEVKDPVTALSLYLMRDIVEKAFWNIKERLNLRRTLTSSESALEGKLFVEFVALIYLSFMLDLPYELLLVQRSYKIILSFPRQFKGG